MQSTPSEKAIEALVFDIGNVIVRFDFSPAVARLQAMSGTEQEDVMEPITEIKNALEGGQMSDAEFIAQAREILAFRGSDEEFRAIWCDIFTPNQPMIELIEKLHSQAPLYLLSNTSGMHMDYLRQLVPILNQFRDGVYSYEVRSMKPHPEIYWKAIERFSLTPERTLYIDDLLANIQAGENLGLQTIHYHPERHAQHLEDFRAWGFAL